MARTPPPPVRIALSDDDPSCRLLLRTALGVESGFDVVGEAANGIEAVRIAEALQPDVMLLDLNMPRMGGLDALDRIRVASPGTRVVIFSSTDPSLIEPAALAHGAVAFEQKGADIFALIDRIRAVAGRAVRTAADTMPLLSRGVSLPERRASHDAERPPTGRRVRRVR